MSTDLYAHSDYKAFVATHLEQLPKRGHGEMRRMAASLRVHPVVLSQVFRGQRDLTPEQACELAHHLKLTEPERDYFLLMVQKARAGTARLRQTIEAQMTALRKRAGNLKAVMPNEVERLTEEQEREFYSSWQYSAVRLHFELAPDASAEEIARRFSLPVARVREVVAFLLTSGLCVKAKSGIQLGPKSTHLSADSPLITRHRLNWRLKALERQPDASDEADVSYSGLMALSESAAKDVRRKVTKLIQEAARTALPSKAERLMLLNVDWMGL